MRGVTYAREPLPMKAYAEFRPLFDRHGVELRGMPAVPDVAFYQSLEDKGHLVAVTARLEDGRGIGYSVHVVAKDFHFGLTVAHDDVWYVEPEYRRQGVGFCLRLAALEELKKAGVDIVYGRLKVDHPHAKSMAMLGYAPFETVYMKDLRDGH